MNEVFIRLCRLDELPDPSSRQFRWGEGVWPLEFFAVRRGKQVFGYVNQCPHAGHQLNWMPDRFLTQEGDLILCNSHGARFRIEDGLCVEGPCPGESLKAIRLEVRDGKIVVREAELRSLFPAVSRPF